MGVRIHVLGAGSILPRAGYGCAGYALVLDGSDDITLLDCGPGSIRNLAAAGLRVENVKRIVFSHYHLDHCLDLFALIFARRNPTVKFAHLSVYGPVGLRRLIEDTPKGLGHYAVDSDIEWNELDMDARGVGRFRAAGMRFTGAANGHCGEAVSWRIEGPGGGAEKGSTPDWCLAYSGDTGDNPVVARIAKKADLFLCECSFAEEEAQPNHLTPLQAGRLAATAGARKLVLTHFYPSLRPEDAAARAADVFDGPIETARDGSTHLPDELPAE